MPHPQGRQTSAGGHGSGGRWLAVLGAMCCLGGFAQDSAAYPDGQALGLDGVDDFIEISDQQYGFTDWSVELWLKTTSEDGYILGDGDADGDLRLIEGRPSTSCVQAPSAVNDGKWHHLVTQRQASTCRVYIDGALAATASQPQTYAFGVKTLGQRVTNNGFLKGLLSELRIYRRAVSTTEIAAHYNNGSGQRGQPEAGLAAGWHLDEGGGATVADYSGNGLAGSLRGGPVWMARNRAPGAREFFVATTGQPIAAGTQNDPWDLQTALAHPLIVEPGDTIWIQGGTYVGSFVGRLVGNATAPIIVRNYQGQRVILDGRGTQDEGFVAVGTHVWYWGLEIMDSDTLRQVATTGSARVRGGGITGGAPFTKIINCIIHDTDQGIGIWPSPDGGDIEVYGNIIYYNGWTAPDRGHGHAIYAQNQFATPRFIDNIMFSQFSHGFHGYGSDESFLNNFYLEGNVSFNQGSLEGLPTRGYLIGGGSVAESPVMIGNYSYFSPGFGGENNVGYDAGCRNPMIKDNYFAAENALSLVNCQQATITGNSFVGRTNVSSTEFPQNTWIPQPSGLKVVVKPNKYDLARAHVIIYNWGGLSAVPIDPAGLLQSGQRYALHNVQDYFGDVLTGTYTGGPVSVPMTGRTIATPVGVPAPTVKTFPYFGVFVLVNLDAAGGSTPATVATPEITPNGGAFTGSVQVSVGCATQGATIRYTTNGNEPTASSGVYSGPFTLLSTTTVKAKAFKSGIADSSTASATFTAQVPPPINQSPMVDAGQDQTMTLPAGAVLTGIVTDDGLPTSTLSTTWSKLSGPGSVTFSSPSALNTSVIASTAGTYVLQLIASDGALSAADQVQLVVQTAVDATPPTLSAEGAHNLTQTSAWIEWLSDEPATSQVSYGPTPAYGSQTALAFTLSTSHGVALSGLTPGVEYHYCVLSKDAAGNLATSADLTFRTLGLPNQAPTVSAGPDQAITLPSTVSLAGTAADDGVPSATLMTTWSSVSGPGSVTFADASAAQTTASFSVAGSYVLRLTADDRALSVSDDLQVTVDAAAPPPPVNQAPVLDAGADQTITLPAAGLLTGTATDDGLPTKTLITTWAALSGPGSVSFGSADALNTTADFSQPGAYLLQLTTSDGEMTVADQLQIVVQPPIDAAPPAVSGVGAHNITQLDARIEWQTDEPATSQVAYGPTPVYGSQTALDAQLTSGHGVPLGGLTPGTEYHYCVMSQDAAGNLTRSIDMTFRTLSPPNQAPTVNAGADQTVPLLNPVVLLGTASDYGAPAGTLDVVWSVVSGPGSVVFADPRAPQTSAMCSAAGTYVLQLRADDGALATVDQVTVTLMPPVDTTPPVVTVLSPINGQLVKHGSQVTILANASDAGGIARVEFSIDGVWRGADQTAPYSYVWKVPNRVGRWYVIRALAVDKAGNAASSIVITVKSK